MRCGWLSLILKDTSIYGQVMLPGFTLLLLFPWAESIYYYHYNTEGCCCWKPLKQSRRSVAIIQQANAIFGTKYLGTSLGGKMSLPPSTFGNPTDLEFRTQIANVGLHNEKAPHFRWVHSLVFLLGLLACLYRGRPRVCACLRGRRGRSLYESHCRTVCIFFRFLLFHHQSKAKATIST